jgi:DNA topoisomerase-1
VAIARTNPHQVLTVEGKIKRQSPPAPFITSTLQQAAGAKLRFNPDQTMKVAQSLYEAGHITYMRTDSVVLSAPFCNAVRTYLTQRDPTNVPRQTTKHRAVKGAQAAHEAIRPTDVGVTPQQLENSLSTDAASLYELIWNRTVASQCCPARLRKTRIVTQSGEAYWEARGQVVEFVGYTKYWNNLSADSQLPTLQPNQAVILQQAEAEQKQTQPPPRYTEPKLVQLMEKKGIGRPSTYAPTIKTLRSRTYAHLLKGKLQPTELGLALDAALELLLPDLIQPEFTAKMEADLDAIAAGKQNWETYLTTWNKEYFSQAIQTAKTRLAAEQMKALRAGSTFAAAKASLPSDSSSTNDSSTNNLPSVAKQARSRKARPQATPQKGKTNRLPSCPKCQQAMSKIPSRSKKLKANHFLKCADPLCDTVLFWNPKRKSYELPYAKQAADPKAFTNYPCPSCGALLIKHSYQKEGKPKTMLRCSIPANRKANCKDVAYFQSRDGGYWSPKFGTLAEIAP